MATHYQVPSILLLYPLPSPFLLSFHPLLLHHLPLSSLFPHHLPQTMITYHPWISAVTIFCVVGVILLYLTIYCYRSKPKQRRPCRVVQGRQKANKCWVTTWWGGATQETTEDDYLFWPLLAVFLIKMESLPMTTSVLQGHTTTTSVLQGHDNKCSLIFNNNLSYNYIVCQ